MEPLTLYSTTYLIGAMAAMERPRQFLLELFFPVEQAFDTEEIAFDKLEQRLRLAPFVSPYVAGKPSRSRGSEVKSFVPAYVKPKHIVDPNRMLKRRPGESLGAGTLTPAERFTLATLDNIATEDAEIARREEWMASEIVRKGQVVVEGEDYPSQLIAFGRNPNHTVVLTGAARWGEAGVSPYDDIKGWAETVATNAGYNPKNVIMDPKAAGLFLKDPQVKSILDIRRQLSGGLELAGAVTGAPGEEVVYLGSLGQFDFWQYQQIYRNADGTVGKMMPDYTVVLGSPAGAQGTRTYGAIRDARALVALPRFPKMWEQDDPSVVYTMTQSAPLLVLGQPDATACATVR